MGNIFQWHAFEFMDDYIERKDDHLLHVFRDEWWSLNYQHCLGRGKDGRSNHL